MEGNLPWPDDAPPEGACVRVDEPEPGLLRLAPVSPHRSFPVLDGPLLRDLEAAVARIEADPPKGLLLVGRRSDQFLAGADVRAIARARDPEQIATVVRAVHALFDRIDRLPCRVVAAVGGPVPGGAYELCLACDAIVLANDARTRVGLPETKLGLLPAWGGTHRLTKRVGVPAAATAILAGTLHDPRRAKRIGLVDRLTPPEYLERIGADVALGRERLAPRKRGWRAFLVDRNPLVKAVVERSARKTLDERTGGHYPAPYAALEAVLEAPSVPRAKWADVEARLAARLVASDACRHLVGLFLGTEEQKRLADAPDGGTPARKVERAAVVGAGVMGAGIASALAQNGIDVRLADLARAALDRAQADHRAAVEKRRKRTGGPKADAAIDRLTVSRDIDGMRRTDIVVEAVAETVEIKQSVFSKIEKAAPDALLATNTSSLSVTRLASTLERPERLVGLHFFNPVAKMPLVEVIRGEHTSDEAFRTAAALAVKLGKTPVEVADVPGFLVNRLLGPYLDEAMYRFVNGADVEGMDAAARAFGMPMGPFELLDEVGLDIALHTAHSLSEGYGERMRPTEGLDRMATKERLGKKAGKGFYVHRGKGRGKKELADDLATFRSGTNGPLSASECFDAAVLAFANEAALALGEGVVASARELDLAVVLGTGFAPFRGGPLHWIDAVGAQEIVRRLEALHATDQHTHRRTAVGRFAPAPLLVEHARSGARFHEPLA
ncbi:MAG: 3-hydroxyacyl-CoA dehydrogenase NAD-binding domain-containing protein [Planctomycetota bacterium]